MLPTSLPGGNPSGMVAARPTSARRASAANVGRWAASSGVRPPSSATGSSAAPSGTQTTYFIRVMLRLGEAGQGEGQRGHGKPHADHPEHRRHRLLPQLVLERARQPMLERLEAEVDPRLHGNEV